MTPRRLLALCLAVFVAGGALAQEVPPAEAPPAEAQIGPPAAGAIAETVIGGIDYVAWARSAQRSAVIIENATGSTFALERMRNDLVVWRDRFLNAEGVNAARIATVDAQIAALGPAPGDGATEDERITARRGSLLAERARLAAPVALAREAYAQADGLIGEIDRLIRSRQAEAMTTRGPSPLAPGNWATVMSDVTALAANLWTEATVTLRSEIRRERFRAALPEVLFYLIAGGTLLLRSRRWVGTLVSRVTARGGRGEGVWVFLLSLGQLVLPFVGLSMVVEGIVVSGMAGFRLSQVIDEVANAGAFVILARWLAERTYGPGARVALPDDFDADRRERARLHVNLIGWLIAAGAMALAVLDAGETAAVTGAAVILPIQVMLCWSLYRLGRLLLAPAGAADGDGADAVNFRRGLLSLLGRLVIVVAAVGPVLSAAGFSVAAEALTYPAVMTLGLIALVILLQTFVFDLYAFVTGGEDGSRDALLPVIIGVFLVLAALPALALFWGVRVEDLTELWTRFREGYAIGDTRISPTDFLTFVVIFAGGFMITRLLQGVLRTAILPKTRMDAGGRTAVISGTGYVGVFLSALFAITSVGLDLSNLAIVAGALSVGIGFGLQNIVSNFISGIILLIERPISEGDWIEVGGKMGYVRDISVRSTRIETFDRTQVIVPNADLISGQVTNWTRGSAVGRIIVPVSVMFGSDIDRVLSILREIAEGHPMVLLNPPPSVVLNTFGPDVLNFEIRAIVRDVNFGLTIRSEMNVEIARRFFDEGIEFAGAPRANGAAARTAASPAPATPEMRITIARDRPAAAIDSDDPPPALPDAAT